MVYISFIYPEALALLLVLVPLIAITLMPPHRLTPLRRWMSLALRVGLMLALILSIAGTQLVFPVDRLTTIFVLDSSDSLSPEARGQAEVFIRQALQTMREDDQAGIVVFGEQALVEHTPDTSRTLGQIRSFPQPTHTNIEKALQLGMALFPAETQKRIVLLSDGGENSGDALNAARLAANRTIPIDIVDLSNIATTESAAEVLIASFNAPTHARKGQEIALQTVIESSTAQSARLTLFADDQVLTSQQVQLVAGRNEIAYTLPAEGQGFQRFRARIEPQNDQRIQNNETDVMIQVHGIPRILLVASSEDDTRNMQDALAAANITAETVAPEYMPTTLSQLNSYQAVVLVNVPARKLPDEVLPILPAYVRDLGKGLVMIGGEQSYGAGGYSRTPIEEALPVSMDVQDRIERPNLGLVFLIDKSGSMDACHCNGDNQSMNAATPNGIRKIDIAKDAIVLATPLLGSQDTLSIIGFDDAASHFLPPTRAPEPEDVVDAISNMQPIGSTNIGAGLLEAEKTLNGMDARIKHVVLLTDGWGNGENYGHVAQRMYDNGITLSVIAAGQGSAEYLKPLADKGGGRYYPTTNMSEVPQIFLEETVTASGNYIVDEPFTPAVMEDSAILHQVADTGFPTLYGYNGSTIKNTARLILAANDGLPILAEWNYGLGRSIAWTSDMKGKWGSSLVTWDNYPRFVAQLVNEVIPVQDNTNIAAEIQHEGTHTTIIARTEEHAAKQDIRLQARVISNEALREGETSDTQHIDLIQVAPGEYRATIASPTPGTYMLQLVGSNETTTLMQETVGMVVPYSSEYRQHQDNPALLEDLVSLTNGSRITTPAASFAHNLQNVSRAQEISFPLLILALVLLPIDIAVRRLNLRWQDWQRGQMWVQGILPQRTRNPIPATPDPVMSRLMQAKQRATGKSAPMAQSSQDQAAQAEQHPSPTAKPASPSHTPKADSPSTGKDTKDIPDDPLERLRLAKERARRRARGEEE